MDIQTTLDREFYENNPRWEVKLSNGVKVYSDNQYINGFSDWERVQNYCNSNDVKIVGFCFGFRDHLVHLQDDCKYYYFRRRLKASFAGTEKSYFVVGAGNHNIIEISKYSMPEVILEEKEERNINDTISMGTQ